MSVNTVEHNVNVAHKNRCIVCNGEHCFENCDTLNNSAFLHQHNIRFCQNGRKDRVTLTAGQVGNRPYNTNVHYLDTEECQNQMEDLDEEPGNRHFQCGHF